MCWSEEVSGVGGVGAGKGHASLASYEEGGLYRAGKKRASLACCVGRGFGGVGAGMGHASLASYEEGGLSRAGKKRASLARCVGRGVGGDGAGMGHASPSLSKPSSSASLKATIAPRSDTTAASTSSARTLASARSFSTCGLYRFAFCLLLETWTG